MILLLLCIEIYFLIYLNFYFYKTPFLYLTSFFIIGILIAEEKILNFNNSFFYFSCYFFALFYLLKKKKLSFIFILISLVSLGVYRQKNVDSLFKGDLNMKKKSLFLLQKYWKRTIGKSNCKKIKQEVRGEIGLTNKKSVLYIKTPYSIYIWRSFTH